MKKENLEVYVLRSVMDIFHRYRQITKRSCESGGILLGQVTKNRVYVIKITTPNKFDRASRYSFECNKDAAQVIIDYEFVNSGNKTIYLGEWHTHPEDYPIPSIRDKAMIVEQFLVNKINEPFLILYIQGIIGSYVAIYDGDSIKEVKLNIINDL